jgi:hypothetical protein
MKGEVYKCDRCDKLSSDIINDRWIEIKTTKGELQIKRAGIKALSLDSSNQFHFCSPHCLLEFLLDHIQSSTINNEELTKELIEIFEVDSDVDNVDSIATFKVELNGKIPSDVWRNEVSQLGLNPDDYVISNEDGHTILNIYKSYYHKNE